MTSTQQPPGEPRDVSPPVGDQADDAFRDTCTFAASPGATSVSEANPQSEEPAKSEPLAETPKSDLPRSIGRYQVRSKLGGGAFGVVYLGYDPHLDRQVAIKVPKFDDLEDSRGKAEQDFLSEARQLAKLSHPAIVSVFEVGIEDEVCYIVSDFVDGPDLSRWLKTRTPSWQESVRIVATIADALAAAHSRSIVHRDVKPANVIMTERAEGWMPILMNFGLALSDSTAASASAQRGVITGTPSYMSPEPAQGDGHRIDGRTDIYAAGVILYRMLSGLVPFEARDIRSLLQMVIEDEPRPPRQFVHNLPRELERIYLKALAKKMADRYTTVGDMARELRNLLQQEQAEAEAVRLAATAKARPKSRDGMKILIAEDHELTRFKLQSDLEKWGHSVVAAQDGAEAWELFQKEEFSLVITDWMMPHVDGVELVRRIRGADRPNYVYVIMLTSKAEKHDIVTGMNAGADDFLGKPFHRDELKVRLRAGARITKLNRELSESNLRLKSGLEAAGQIQRSFLPTTKPRIAGFDFAWSTRASANLGGDMFNVVSIDKDNVGIYVLDVTGEGVSAALLVTKLSRILSSAFDPASQLVERTDDGSTHRVLEPSEVAQRLNQQFSGQEANQYFTLAYGVLHLASREFRFTSAGHPPLLHQKLGGSPRMLDVGGYPIGMAPASEPFEQAVRASLGDIAEWRPTPDVFRRSARRDEQRRRRLRCVSLDGIGDTIACPADRSTGRDCDDRSRGVAQRLRTERRHDRVGRRGQLIHSLSETFSGPASAQPALLPS